MVTVRPKANTVASRRIAPTRGSPGGLRATSARTPASATIIPTAPPISASSRLSVSTCRVSRPCPAPSAARIANSPRRCAPRASSRLVTFTHAMARTSVTAPSSARSAGLTARVTSCCSALTTSPCRSDAHGTRGNSGSGCAAIASSSDRPPSSPTRGCRRPIIRRWCPHSRPSGVSDVLYWSGAQTSADAASTFSKPGGITPMTRKGLSSSAISRPTTETSPPRRRVQSAWLSMATRGPFTRSSEG